MAEDGVVKVSKDLSSECPIFKSTLSSQLATRLDFDTKKELVDKGLRYFINRVQIR